MTDHIIDNTDAGLIERTITWQYENATKLVSLILSWKEFFKHSTTDLFDGIPPGINLTNTDISDYWLSVWGNILNVRRPMLTYLPEGESEESTLTMSRELFRRILLGRSRLLEDNASVPAYLNYINIVFGPKMKMIDGLDMGISFVENGELTNEELAAIEQCPDVVFVFPAGVRSAEHSQSLMFGLDGQQNEADVVNVGGLDESGFNWRLTPKGNWK
jgi:hypothetical protein